MSNKHTKDGWPILIFCSGAVQDSLKKLRGPFYFSNLS